MTSPFSWSQTSESPVVVAIRGRITKDAEFSGLVELARQGPLSIDLGGVDLISSTGVREWILFMRSLEGLHAVELQHMAPTMVRQISLVAGFVGPSTVRSILLPYYCDACGHEQTTPLILEGEVKVAEFETCASCGKQAEFDDIVHRYLAFHDGSV